jgi:hypothetical protein
MSSRSRRQVTRNRFLKRHINAENVQGVDVILEIGEITATVTIATKHAQLETENANVNKAITTNEVKRLPQVGRDPYELARLTPGVLAMQDAVPNGNSSGLPNSPGPGGSNNSIFQAENQVQITRMVNAFRPTTFRSTA